LGDIVRFDIEQVTTWLNSGDLNSVDDVRKRQLADLSADSSDNAECAAADLLHEFSSKP